LFTTASASAACLLLFRLTATASSFIHSSGTLIRGRHLIRNVCQHLSQFEVLLVGSLCSFSFLMRVPQERHPNYRKHQRERNDHSGNDVARIRRARPHYCRATFAT